MERTSSACSSASSSASLLPALEAQSRSEGPAQGEDTRHQQEHKPQIHSHLSFLDIRTINHRSSILARTVPRRTQPVTPRR